jgi:hypothetical protein
MVKRWYVAIVLVGIAASMGAQFPTTNFLVEAPTPQIAQLVGQYAEHYRKQKAIEWLGHEMPNWPERCPIHVKVTANGPSGATSFAFDRGRVLGQHMHIEGPLDRLVASVLPHEVTHTVFAHYYRCPVPRWADEGGAVLSEDEMERDRHDKLVRQVLNTPGRRIPLRRLFTLHDYPGDVMVLYAEGFSVANFLVNAGGKPNFLGFIHHGMSAGWDSAVKTYYRYNSVEELQEAWLAQLRATKGQPLTVAQNTNPNLNKYDTSQRVIVHQTVPPMSPDSGTIYRGQAADSDYEGKGQLTATGRLGYLPEPAPLLIMPPMQAPSIPATNSGSNGWQRQGVQVSAAPNLPFYQPPPVQLGSPLYMPSQTAELGRPIPAPASPVGFPR